MKDFPDFNSLGYNYTFNGTGIAVGDINNDGLIDLFTLDMLPEEHYEQKLVDGPDNYERLAIREKRAPDFSLSLEGRAMGFSYIRVFSTKNAEE